MQRLSLIINHPALMQRHTLTTDTGYLFDSNVIALNQTITSSLARSDSRAFFKEFLPFQRYYSDGYYLSADSLEGEDQVTIRTSSVLRPDLYIMNAQTGEVIDSLRGTRSNRNLSYILDVEEGIDYLILFTSNSSGSTGQYSLTVEN